MAKIITVTSGKGGVGKTGISLNLSLALAQKGFKVCLFDADLGLANVNIITGLFPEHSLEEVIEGRLILSDIIIKNYQGIDIIPGSSGIQKMADLTAEESNNLVRAFMDMDGYDYFIIDTSAGISSQVLSFCLVCHEILLVVTPEPTSLTDAYSLLKVLGQKSEELPPIKVVVNQVKKADTAQAIYKKLKGTAYRFLSIKLSPLGVVAFDSKVRTAIISQTPFLLAFPDSVASRCIHSLAKKLTKKPFFSRKLPLEFFWQSCLDMCKRQKSRKPIQDAVQKPTEVSPSSAPKTLPPPSVPAVASDPRMETLAKSVVGMEDKITQLTATISEMHSLLMRFVEKNSALDSGNVIESEKDLWDTMGEDPESCVVVPLKPSKKAGTESLKAMEAELPVASEVKPPKSGKLFFDFEAWLQAKSQSSK